MNNTEDVEISKYIEPDNKQALLDAVQAACAAINELLKDQSIKSVSFDLGPQEVEMNADCSFGWCFWKGLRFCSCYPDCCNH